MFLFFERKCKGSFPKMGGIVKIKLQKPEKQGIFGLSSPDFLIACLFPERPFISPSPTT
jgi:hypothetical protein